MKSIFLENLEKLKKEIKIPNTKVLSIWRKNLKSNFDFELTDELLIQAYLMYVSYTCLGLKSEFKDVFYYSKTKKFSEMINTLEREMMIHFIKLALCVKPTGLVEFETNQSHECTNEKPSTF